MSSQGETAAERPPPQPCPHAPNGKGAAGECASSRAPGELYHETMMDFKNDRKSSDPRKANTNRIISFAKAMTRQRAGGHLFQRDALDSVNPRRRGQCRPRANPGGVFPPARWSRDRTASQLASCESRRKRNRRRCCVTRDPVSSPTRRWAASSAVGAGDDRMGGKTTACSNCHGANLQGMGPVPRGFAEHYAELPGAADV